MQTAYITHPDCLKHDMGGYHPECPQRLVAIQNQLQATGLLSQLQHYEAPLVTTEQLARVHTPDYIESIRQTAPAAGLVMLDADTAMNPFTWNAALRAAGAVVLATDLVLNEKVKNAFCAIRPPGHHAESNRAMGFCLFNNVAVGVAHAIQQYHLQQVAILDFDVHHGNGSEEIFRDNSQVMLCSTFQHPFYPYCGADSATERMINVPLPYGADGTVFRKAVTDIWLPALDVLATDLVLNEKVKNAFCAIRPPGHHAESNRAMGFCLFNNVAVGVAHAIQQYHLQQVAILDFDVHHGNGSEEIFRDNSQVMLCSTFQHPFYPYCGADSATERMINVPLPYGADGTVFRKAVTDIWLPALDKFKPEMIFVSAGFDAHRDDEMAQLQLIDEDYVWITQQIKAIANKYAHGRIVSVLEGGYELNALGRCVAAHISMLGSD